MLGGEKTSSISRLVALKPRQVLLAEQKEKLKPRLTMAKKQLKEQPKQETDTPKAELKLALLHSVIKYVHDKGFAKTFKWFLKEARVEDDAWKVDSFDLEEMYRDYLEKCRDGDTNFKGQKEQEQSAYKTMEKDADGDKDVSVETISKKKKKKRSGENDDNAKSAICELKTDESMRNLIDKKKEKSKLMFESLDENGTCKESLHDVTERIPETFETVVGNDNKDSVKTTKSKDKSKKQKIETVSPLEDGKGAENAVIRDKNAVDIPLDDSKTRLKEKKKKKKDALSEKLTDNGVENKGKSEETSDNVAKKESKKRKRSDSDENKDKPVEGATIEESKWRKSEDVKEAKVAVEVNTVLGGIGNVGGENKEKNGTQKSSAVEPIDKSTKGDLKNNGVEKSSAQKTAKKQRNGSIEPKTVNAFQRVKVDAVEFADERLQDNSYWAKAGAEVGYGAKAQEVLGQVKGRGFRHEKTKKKRGSYRGGQIDLQSHSVKFNYSDEEGFRHEKTKKKRGSYRGGQIDLQSHLVKLNYSDEE